MIAARRRREQSGFTKGRSTLDRVLALNLLAQERREYRQPLYAAYVDLKAAFDSIDRKALYLLLAIIGILEKLVALFRALCSDVCSCVRSETTCSDWFPVETGVRQGCVLSPDAFAVAEDRMMEKVVERSELGASIGDVTVTDFDFADDVAILSEMLEVLTEALVVFEDEASALGLHVNWAKTKIQCLDGSDPGQTTVPVGLESVEVVDTFNQCSNCEKRTGGSA